MKTTIYMGISLDGFVARPDDGLDFLPAPPDEAEAGEDAFTAFLRTVDALVMGRRTFEVVMGFGPDGWAYGQTPLVVLSRSLTDATLPEGTPPTVRVAAGEPAVVLADLEAQGVGHVYVDGAQTARDFLARGLVTDLVITLVPVLIGEGISLWGPLPGDVRLSLVDVKAVGGGMAQLHYQVVKG